MNQRPSDPWGMKCQPGSAFASESDSEPGSLACTNLNKHSYRTHSNGRDSFAAFCLIMCCASDAAFVLMIIMGILSQTLGIMCGFEFSKTQCLRFLLLRKRGCLDAIELLELRFTHEREARPPGRLAGFVSSATRPTTHPAQPASIQALGRFQQWQATYRDRDTPEKQTLDFDHAPQKIFRSHVKACGLSRSSFTRGCTLSAAGPCATGRQPPSQPLHGRFPGQTSVHPGSGSAPPSRQQLLQE
ncbi:hypothetical protein K503DRAFT_859991 [Rhizopogon vinicolor AM-OR11-026]|uniref:Uncharacterized protein n=1 Tax=Rhizopogon vinicolor AM-OR11-026 TaxID=1314800 RepID=A0A1B7MKG2_9AGAM|nr:hypothetical protein K503DRAFT_859991 [Rhizopogon vinicolor AM-OR11-026]